MSEPRIIPADEARRLREAATPGPWAWGEDDNIYYTRGDGEPIEQGGSWRYVILGARLDKDGDPIVVYPWEVTEWNENPENLDGEDDEFYEPTVLMDGQLAEPDAALIAAAPSLAHTVERQDEKIAQQAAQIKRLRAGLMELDENDGDIDALLESKIITWEDVHD